MKILKKIMVDFGMVVISFMLLNSSSYADKSKSLIVDWNSEEGMKRLTRSKHKVDFFSLSNNFEAQALKTFCGPASVTIVLNSLRLRKNDNLPTDPILLLEDDLAVWSFDTSLGFERYTQNNIFEKSDKPRTGVHGGSYVDNDGTLREKEYGFSLKELSQVFINHNTDVVYRQIDASSGYEALKKELIKNLSEKDNYVVINYYRQTLDQPGGGHFSPLGAYHRRSKSFLVMDVNPNKASWVWVDEDLLIMSMSKENSSNVARGYIMISEQYQ